MKKIILIAVCGTLFTAASYAQRDTTSTQRQSQDKTRQQSDQMRNRTDDQDQDMKGWTRIQGNDIPANLRQTLSGEQYTGWEGGTIYRNQAGDTYSLRTSDKNNPKTYYFDKNGKVTKRPEQRPEH